MTEAVCVCQHRTDPDRPRRAMDGLRVCAGHRAGMLRHLRMLAALDGVLAVKSAAASAARSGSRSAELRIPYDDAAGTLRGHIRRKLTGWAVAVAHDRGLTPPRVDAGPSRTLSRYVDTHGAVRTVSEPQSPVRTICGWLDRQHDWITAQPGIGPEGWTADDYATELSELCWAAFGAAYPSGRRRIPVAPCPVLAWSDVATRITYRCGGRLYVTVDPGADLLPASAVCGECGWQQPTRRWLALAAADPWLTAVELSALWAVPLKTVERWARVAGWEHDQGRPARYRAVEAQHTHDRYRLEETA